VVVCSIYGLIPDAEAEPSSHRFTTAETANSNRLAAMQSPNTTIEDDGVSGAVGSPSPIHIWDQLTTLSLRCRPCEDARTEQVRAVTSLNGVHVRPAERAAAEQHVADERLDRRLADEPHEEHLLDDLRRHGP